MADERDQLLLDIFGDSDDEDEAIPAPAPAPAPASASVPVSVSVSGVEAEPEAAVEPVVETPAHAPALAPAVAPESFAFRELKELARKVARSKHLQLADEDDDEDDDVGGSRRRKKPKGKGKDKVKRKGKDKGKDKDRGKKRRRKADAGRGGGGSETDSDGGGGYYSGEDVIRTKVSKSDDEDDAPMNPIDVAMAAIKSTRRHKNTINTDQIAEGFVKKMRAAVEADRNANRNHMPTVSMLKLLPEVTEMLVNEDMGRDLIDSGVLKVIGEWLWLLPSQCLPPTEIRSVLLKHLLALPINPTDLEEEIGGDIGKAVRFLRDCKEELNSNRKAAKALMSKWMRMLFNLSTDHSRTQADTVQVEVAVNLSKSRDDSAGAGAGTAGVNAGAIARPLAHRRRTVSHGRVRAEARAQALARSMGGAVGSGEQPGVAGGGSTPSGGRSGDVAAAAMQHHAMIPDTLRIHEVKHRPKGIPLVDGGHANAMGQIRMQQFHKKHQQFLRDPKVGVATAAKMKIGMGLT